MLKKKKQINEHILKYNIDLYNMWLKYQFLQFAIF